MATTSAEMQTRIDRLDDEERQCVYRLVERQVREAFAGLGDDEAIVRARCFGKTEIYCETTIVMRYGTGRVEINWIEQAQRSDEIVRQALGYVYKLGAELLNA